MTRLSTTNILPIFNPELTEQPKLSNYSWKKWAKASLVFATTTGAFLALKAIGSFSLIAGLFGNTSKNDDISTYKQTIQPTQHDEIHLSLLTENIHESSKLAEFKEVPLHNFQKRQPSLFPEVIELSSLDGTNGFKLDGEAADDLSGYSVSVAGDINGDGIADLIVGAHGATPSGKSAAGKSYVIFGHSGPWNSSIELSSLDGVSGFVLNGEAAGDESGRSVSAAGDVNQDGVDDLIIGALYATPSGKSAAGKSYVIFGHSGSWNSSIELSSLDGVSGFVLNGEAADDHSGFSVSAAGDVNRDGVDDLIVGARDADPYGGDGAGKSYLIFGHSGPWNSSIELSSLDGVSGFVLNGEAWEDWSGVSVSVAGDVNQDGVDDLIVGAYGPDPSGKSRAGRSYLIFGHSGTWPSSIELSSLNGTTGFVLNGEAALDKSGYSVSAAGDINGDGIADLIVGAHGADPSGRSDAGRSYVIFGYNGTWPSSIELSSLNGANGFKLDGEVENDWSSWGGVNSAGDINNDGIADLIIGTCYVDPSGRTDAGRSYVIFGRSAKSASEVSSSYSSVASSLKTSSSTKFVSSIESTFSSVQSSSSSDVTSQTSSSVDISSSPTSSSTVATSQSSVVSQGETSSIESKAVSSLSETSSKTSTPFSSVEHTSSSNSETFSSSTSSESAVSSKSASKGGLPKSSFSESDHSPGITIKSLLATILASIGGVASVVTAGIGTWFKYRKYKIASRMHQQNPFAAEIRKHANINISDFESSEGQKYIRLVDKLASKLKEQGVDVEEMDQEELRTVTLRSVKVIKDKVEPKKSWLGRKQIHVEDLKKAKDPIITRVINKSVKGKNKNGIMLQISKGSGAIDSDELSKFKEIGRGAMGVVYKARYHGSDVAVKQLPINAADSNELKQFEQEAELMKELRHPHVVNFYGYYQDPTHYSIVMEYVSGGSLDKVLYDTQQPFPWLTRWDVAHDIASAVSFLHSNHIIHRDLKSQNVLVYRQDDRMRAKVADVGIAKIMKEEEMGTMTKGMGTPLWMAPEVVKAQGEGKKITYDERVDVYSYGIILSELINRRVPFSEIENFFEVIPKVLKGKRPAVDKESAPTSFVTLMERCWAQRAAERPEIKEVVETLDQMEQEVQLFEC